MNSIQNSVALIGNLGRDVELKTTQSGGQIANFSLATTYKYTNKSTGEKMSETDWHRCVAFNKSAEILGQYGKKGQRIAVQGRIKYGTYTDKDGIERNTVDIIVNDFMFLGSKNDSQNNPTPAQASTAPANAESAPVGQADDDLPF